MLGAVFNRVVGGVASLAWLGVWQFADARLCFMGCIVCTIVSIAVCAWMTTVTEFYIVVLTMTTASSGSFIFAKVPILDVRCCLFVGATCCVLQAVV